MEGKKKEISGVIQGEKKVSCRITNCKKVRDRKGRWGGFVWVGGCGLCLGGGGGGGVGGGGGFSGGGCVV